MGRSSAQRSSGILMFGMERIGFLRSSRIRVKGLIFNVWLAKTSRRIRVEYESSDLTRIPLEFKGLVFDSYSFHLYFLSSRLIVQELIGSTCTTPPPHNNFCMFIFMNLRVSTLIFIWCSKGYPGPMYFFQCIFKCPRNIKEKNGNIKKVGWQYGQ